MIKSLRRFLAGRGQPVAIAAVRAGEGSAVQSGERKQRRDQIDKAWRILDQLNAEVRHTEIKLGILLAIGGTLATVLVPVASLIGGTGRMLPYLGVTALTLYLAVVMAMGGLMSRTGWRSTRRPSARPDQRGLNSVRYGSGHITSDSAAYGSMLIDRISDDVHLLGHISEEVYERSRVLEKKYYFMTFSTIALVGAIVMLTSTAFVGWSTS